MDTIIHTQPARSVISRGSSDAEPLQALWDAYRKAAAEWSAACDAESRAIETAREYHPAPDKDFFVTWEGGPPEGRCAMYHELAAMFADEAKACVADHHEVREGYERLERYAKWKAACKAIDEERGVPEAKKAHERAGRKMDAAEKRFIAVQPRTVQGILLRLEYLADVESMRDGTGNCDDLASRVVLDLITHVRAALARAGSNLPFAD